MTESTLFHRALWGMCVAPALFFLWLLLSGGAGWPYGLTAAAIAGVLAAWVAPGEPVTLRPLALMRFFGFFLRVSLQGGIDVALRALRPSMPLDSRWVRYQTRLQTPAARALFIIAISLTPGTLVADVAGDILTVHVLDPAMADGLDPLEQAIAASFGETLDARP